MVEYLPVIRDEPTRHRVNRNPLRVLAPTSAAAALAVGVLIAGCSNGPERDSETGALVEATDVNVFDLRVGDCLDGFSDDPEISTVRAVPCSEEHTDEIMAAVDLSEEDEFPGVDAVKERAEETCHEQFEQFVGVPWDESQLDFGYLAPTEKSWSDGDREILCTIGDPHQAVTGTLRDTNR
ncbi:MAG TPA: septum formation family protein [Jiangellales bacterium]|nr:septum formation family protein [Jiangellales bacterium]